MSEETKDPQDAARDALLIGIANSVKHASEKLNASSEAEALKNLAAAYAFVVRPPQAH
ncbi:MULTISPECIES: hypothetical protein [unclassified Streptomyces]|uniref:hypothetical protein n=1 Tax=unclassified Streptomyces TaxID=2593676 RepID=UPI0035DC07FD